MLHFLYCLSTPGQDVGGGGDPVFDGHVRFRIWLPVSHVRLQVLHWDHDNQSEPATRQLRVIISKRETAMILAKNRLHFIAQTDFDSSAIKVSLRQVIARKMQFHLNNVIINNTWRCRFLFCILHYLLTLQRVAGQILVLQPDSSRTNTWARSNDGHDYDNSFLLKLRFDIYQTQHKMQASIDRQFLLSWLDYRYF